MPKLSVDRRGLIMAAAATPAILAAGPSMSQPPAGRDPSGEAPSPDQERRMKWWHDAKFGMFVHFGLYAAHGRHEWAMEDEAIPVLEYQKFTAGYNPSPQSPLKWARLAKAAGMKYMVLTSKHHEGFCNWDTKLTNYNAMQLGPKRDVLKDYVEAARSEGLRVGFYYSLMDWHHPDGAKCATDEQARKRFVAYIHGHVRELLTNYGKIDVLWYDVAWPLTAQGWDSEEMNQMVFELQPDIIVNNRNLLPGDFATPEQRIVADPRAWETCMTMNASWGYQRADDDWKTSKTVLQDLITCTRDRGNFLMNIGPRGDGSIPEESVRILSTVGKWMERNGEAIYGSDLCQPRRSNYALFTRKGNTLYMHVHFWPGSTVAMAGLMNQVKSARLLATGQDVKFEQDKLRVRFTGLPEKAPEEPATTIAIECDGEPRQDNIYVRTERARATFGYKEA